VVGKKIVSVKLQVSRSVVIAADEASENDLIIARLYYRTDDNASC